MKLPKTLEELHQPLSVANDELNNQSARVAALRSDTAIRVARIQSNRPEPGNQEENKLRDVLGQTRLPDVLSDVEQVTKNRIELTILTNGMPMRLSAVQREKDVASSKLCDLVASDHRELVKDVASSFSALHGSLTRYFDFLDAIENTGASTTALRPVFPTGFHPRDASGAIHWAIKEMRERPYRTERYSRGREVSNFIVIDTSAHDRMMKRYGSMLNRSRPHYASRSSVEGVALEGEALRYNEPILNDNEICSFEPGCFSASLRGSAPIHFQLDHSASRKTGINVQWPNTRRRQRSPRVSKSNSTASRTALT